MVHQPRQQGGALGGSLRQQFATNTPSSRPPADSLDAPIISQSSLVPSCSFTDSEAGRSLPSEDGLSVQHPPQQHQQQRHHQAVHFAQQPMQHSMQQSLQQPMQQPMEQVHMQTLPVSARVGDHPRQHKQQRRQRPEPKPQQPPQQPPQQQQQQEEPRTPPKADAVARTITPHLSRPAVSRSILHHLAKAFGVHLKGAVATNEISTAKYTLLTFLPVNLFEQFLRVANMYFLLMVILQLIPGLSPTSLFTTVAPLVFVLAVNAIKEGYDDVQRHRNDNQINNRKVLLLSEHLGEHEVYWKDVVAGDLIKVRADEEVPADLVMLASPDPDKLCYVETANLDGETNLKIKYCWAGSEQQKGYSNCKTITEFEPFAQSCRVGCEPPNPKLYVFDGYMEVSEPSLLKNHSLMRTMSPRRRTGSPRVSIDGKPLQPALKFPLDINNLLLRGCVLRKTEWVIGLAINVGNDSKIVQNMTKAPRKVTQLERAMNVLVFVQFSLLVLFSAVLAVLDQVWTSGNIPANWYLQSLNKWPELAPGGLGWLVSFLRFIILLSNMIPISLYVSLEVVKVFQCTLLFNADREMYHEETDTPFVCRTTTLNEELGQVQYVLSDKTGTLTQNIMGFVWASVGGKLYGKNVSSQFNPNLVPVNTPHSIALDVDMQRDAGVGAPPRNDSDPPSVKLNSEATEELDRFLLNLAVCNTVVPTVGPNGPVYQASSPDEEALVQGAAYLGYKLISRTTDVVVVDVQGTRFSYDVLATLEFNSDRKRMSIIVRTPSNKLLLMCKGADTIIYQRLAPYEPGEATAEHLEEMARGGFRTLVIAERELTRQEYEQWQERYQKASVALDDREALMSAEQSAIETNLHLVGATAVEDKLQDGVPQCLEALANAGIKLWVLTGDKVETAISIAFSCHLFTPDMGILEFRESDYVHGKTVVDVQNVLLAKLEGVRAENLERHALPGHTNVGIVIEGGALQWALEPDNQDILMELCKECKAVVCCRVTPMQKAQITLMVKKKAGAITLGIGDGANDVGMIRAAHIGVGISGREGRAAVLASDFSFAQFRYLSRLLLLHGRWSYMRNKEVVLYSFYKNWAYVLVYVYLQFVAGYSSIPIFTTMMISTFNMIFTACPIVGYAVLEQDLRKSTVLQHPETYSLTRTATRAGFFKDFFVYVFVAGTWHSLPVYFLPWYALITPDRSGLHGDLASLGTAVFIALTLTVTLKLSLRTHCWSWITHVVYWVSIGLLLPFVYVISILWASTNISGVADMSGVGSWLYSSAVFWLTAFSGASAIALLPDITHMLFSRYFRPTLATVLQEIELRTDMAKAHEAKQQAKNEQGNLFGGPQPASPGKRLKPVPNKGPTGIPHMGGNNSPLNGGAEMHELQTRSRPAQQPKQPHAAAARHQQMILPSVA